MRMLGHARGTGRIRSEKGRRGERDDEGPGDVPVETLVDERLDVFQQARPVTIVHHLGPGVREHQLPVVGGGVRLVPVVAAHRDVAEAGIASERARPDRAELRERSSEGR